MNRKTISKLVFVFISILMIAEFLYFHPLLPETIASHFNFSGQADGWMNKGSFYILFLIIYFVTFISISGATFIIPRISDKYINLPKKEILLAPERRKSTLEILSVFLIDMNSLTVLLFVLINYVVFSINVESRTVMPFNILYLVLVYVAVIFIMIFRMNRKLKQSISH